MFKEVYFANKRMESCSKSLRTSEMKTKTTLRYSCSCYTGKNLSLKISGVGKNVERPVLSSVTGGNTNWYRHSLAISRKIEDIHIL